MPLEIEAKLRVPSHQLLRDRLVAAGAVRKGVVSEQNIFFDRPDRSLLAKDCGLRVRLCTATDESAPPALALLTYKGPRQQSALQPREAFDLTVMPQAQVVPFLEALGFEQTLMFEKHRESWQLANCLVELDELPILGTFVEIEGPSEAAVQAVRATLDLASTPLVKSPYIALVSDHLQRENSGSRELRFPR